MKKIIVLVLIFFLVVLSGAKLDARFFAPDMKRHMKYGIRIAEQNLVTGHVLLKIKDKIVLTDRQISKIEQMREVQKEKMVKEGEQIKAIEKKIPPLLKQGKTDRKHLEKVLKEVAKLKTQRQINYINYLLDLRELLSDGQLKKIDDIKKGMRMRRLKNCRERNKNKANHTKR